ncbi:hypothetical protein NCAS_0J00480 [Naumovozyma castellii]|uniref:Uncharacterized protein n=1 Tax=Naumovozyma castellii TaxID=27288 RepID=G0VKJ1_NAUCA|nr:hypothetical protein NCAS_0J00480 [Naumovozyma castellii CBS 4309]CCC72027.1 hypothetical protein NCAS_0J00480 [Naumovozyma castellii CBS 4309]
MDLSEYFSTEPVNILNEESREVSSNTTQHATPEYERIEEELTNLHNLFGIEPDGTSKRQPKQTRKKSKSNPFYRTPEKVKEYLNRKKSRSTSDALRSLNHNVINNRTKDTENWTKISNEKSRTPEDSIDQDIDRHSTNQKRKNTHK